MKSCCTILLSFILMSSFSSDLPAQDRTHQRRADLQLLLERLLPSRPPADGRMNARDETWEEWVQRTGELPPDFDALPSNAHLPDPLLLQEEGKTVPIETMKQWERQKEWIREQVEHWVFGTMPPAPDNLRVATSSERREEEITVRDVLLEFGPEHRATLNLQLMIPDGEGPFPVFLTNHSRKRSPWVRTAVSRGYIACYYRATDPYYGDPDDSDAYIDIYPDYDFSCLARWAWAASRAVDYLQTREEVLPDQIGLAGHSRNGKQALLAAAFDERIGAVVASSGLTGEAHPWRYTSDPFVVESLQLLTGARPHWFHPRLRFFAGREHKLPVDQNMLMAMVAPRGLMIYSAYSESSANTFSVEQGYRSAREAYRFHGREENIWLHLREGEHSTGVADVENFMDFFDAVFGRRSFPKVERWIHGYTFEDWQQKSGIQVDPQEFPVREPGDFRRASSGEAIVDDRAWDEKQAEIRSRIHWLLGEGPPVLKPAASGTLKKNSPPRRNWLELIFGRPEADPVWQERLAADGMGSSSISYGTGLDADLFYPVDAKGAPKGKNWPVVIWLHPYAHAAGWSAKRPWLPRQTDFVLDQRPDFASLVRRGFAVVAFDQIGFGSRAHDARTFYERYPEWSLMGKMVADTRAVIDAVAGLDQVDSSRVFLLGYSLGAKVGLLTTALDDRVKGIAAVSGAYPIRHDKLGSGTEGLWHYSHLHGLLPKLGFFAGHEARAPLDYGEVLALAAPRQVLVVAPELDRFNPVEGVREEVEQAQTIFSLLGGNEKLELWTPRDFNRFPRNLQEEVFDYLEEAAGL